MHELKQNEKTTLIHVHSRFLWSMYSREVQVPHAHKQ